MWSERVIRRGASYGGYGGPTVVRIVGLILLVLDLGTGTVIAVPKVRRRTRDIFTVHCPDLASRGFHAYPLVPKSHPA